MSLTAHDRCDSCGAAAQIRATKPRVPDTLEELEFGKPQIMELLFCGHHHKRHFDKLVDEGWSFAP